MLEFLFPADGISAMYLRLSGQSRPDIMPMALFFVIKRQILDQQWSGADDGHIPFQDVEQFGQFIQAGRPQFFAKGSQPDLVRQQFSLCIGL